MTERVVVFSDLHVPYHDHDAWNLFLLQLPKLKPDVVVANGDVGDVYSCSRYDKDPRRKLLLMDELRELEAEMQRLQAAADCPLVFIEGNHEARIGKQVMSSVPELAGMVRPLREVLNLDAEWREYGEVLHIGDVIYTHDVGHCGKTTTDKSLQTVRQNVVVGHSHHAGIAYAGAVGRQEPMWCMNTGHLSDVLFATYASQFAKVNWTQGFGVVDYTDGHGVPSFVPYINGRMRCEHLYR